MTGSNTQTSTKVENTSCKMYIHHSRLHGNNFNYLNETHSHSYKSTDRQPVKVNPSPYNLHCLENNLAKGKIYKSRTRKRSCSYAIE